MRERGKDRVTHRHPSALRSFPLVGDWARAINIRPPLPPPTSHSSPSSTSPPTLAALAVLGHVFAHHWSWPQTLGARKQFRQELADPGASPAVPSSLSPAAASRPTTLDPIILRGGGRRRNRKGEGNISKGISSSLTPLFLLPLISFARSFRPARDGGENKGRMG